MRNMFSWSAKKAALLIGALLSALLISSHANAAGSHIYGAPKGIAIEGYDVVAYFIEGMPAKGSERYTAVADGTVWHFKSQANRDAFVAEPEKYIPQYGGYCAYAAAQNLKADGDPHQWAVVGDKLYLNNNFFAKKLWQLDIPGNIVKGDKNWPALQSAIEQGAGPN